MGMENIEEKKKVYLEDIYVEMRKRGFTDEEIPIIISRTGFMSALDKYPEVQLHYATPDAVDEIIFVAVKSMARISTNMLRTEKFKIGQIEVERFEPTGDFKQYARLEELGIATAEDEKKYLHKEYKTIEDPCRPFMMNAEILRDAIVHVSNGTIDRETAMRLAKEFGPQYDIKKYPMLGHKGVNWYAKKIVKNIYLERYK